MALRVVEKAGETDLGRQREANEDSFVVAPPLFAVADGMGGAKAGEVASAMAAEVLEGAAEGGGTAEERLTALVREANRRIHELAERDSSRRGMGTTLTAAAVGSREVSVAHVGDSRAYVLRDGELCQLTHDHSLVAEMQRSGQITAEDAENHPQRSIITRALGPEAEIEVDSHTHAARPGDVYLLCSDGLTGMVSDAEMAGIVRASGSLHDAVDSLVRAANQSGGRDNITVVLFRLDDDGEAPAEQDTLAAGETVHTGLTTDDVQAAVAEQERAGARAPTGSRQAVRRTASGASSGRGRLRRVAGPLVGLLVLAAMAAGAYLAGRQVYFVGTDDDGLVTVYRGLPYELPLGVDLYSSELVSSVPARTLPAARRERLLDHEWRSREDAEDLVGQLERGSLDLGGRR